MSIVDHYRACQHTGRSRCSCPATISYLLTKLLAPKLLASATPSYTPRVVFVSSAAHAAGSGVDFDAVENPKSDKYSVLAAYSSAKSANILTAIELSKRSKGAINAYSLHPGGEEFFSARVSISQWLIDH